MSALHHDSRAKNMPVEMRQNFVAFVPNPHNLFFLTNSIKRLPPQIRANLKLHAAGAGSSAAAHKLFTQQGNFGNSILDNPNQSDTVPQHTVFTVTLDVEVSSLLLVHKCI